MNTMDDRLEVSQALSNVPGVEANTPAKIHQAAQQFEAILLTQILSMAADEGGWLGSGGDSASGCATGLAEQQLGAALAEKGGIGLAPLIAQGLTAQRS
jgi:Rod binding domain-containing protein